MKKPEKCDWILCVDYLNNISYDSVKGGNSSNYQRVDGKLIETL